MVSPEVLREVVARELPVIPADLQVYNSYTVDPQWQIKFTIIWTSVLAFSTLCSIPYLIRAARRGRLYSGLVIAESSTRSPTPSEKTSNSTVATVGPGTSTGSNRGVASRALGAIMAIYQSLSLWTLPMPSVGWLRGQVADCCRKSYFSLGIGQIAIVLAYAATVVACFTVGAELTQNSNRPGFIALSQLPVIVLLSLKSPLPFPIFLPSLSYEHYNFLHRWAGRIMFLAATVHGGMWLHQFITLHEMDEVYADKTIRGMITYAMLCMIVITSLKPIRRRFYQIFWVAHFIFFTGFFAAISYHTPYSRPWIYPCVAVYAYDHFVRLLRYRIKDATIVPVDESMTMIHIPHCDNGWLPTQHVFIRVIAPGSGIFESHPFTITNAPTTAFCASPRGIILYAKVAGDWTRKVHALASEGNGSGLGLDNEERRGFLRAEENGNGDLEGEGEGDAEVQEKAKYGLDHPGRRVTVVIDGPYGGLKLDLGKYENVLLVAGGSGVTYILGAIEEALRCKEAGYGPRNIDVAWVVRDLSTIETLAPTLSHLHALSTRLGITLSLHLYLTNPSLPLPPLPSTLPSSELGTSLSPFRPEVAQLVREALPPPSVTEIEEGGDETTRSRHGGLAVIAAGPEGLVIEAKNAVAGLTVAGRVRAGGIGFHAEVYAL